MSEYEFLHSVEVEVQARLDMVASTGPIDYAALPESDWQYDPTDVERETVGLRNLIGAIESLEAGSAGTGLDQVG